MKYKIKTGYNLFTDRGRSTTEHERELMGEFDANKQYFTHTEWVKAKEGFGCVVFILFAVSVWFLLSI